MSTLSSASRRRAIIAPLVVGWILGSMSPTRGQSPTFEESIDVSLVNVEVFVHDKKGMPITGLSQKDFQLFEDGRKVKIESFLELRPSTTEATVERIEGASIEAAAPSEHVVLFLDDFAFAPHERKQLIGRLREYVANEMAKDTQIAVASYDSALRTHQPFTDDHDRVLDALDILGEFNPRSTARYTERESAFRSALETLRSIGDGSIGTGSIPAAAGVVGADLDDSARRLLIATQEIDALAAQMRAENRRAIAELAQLVNALGSLPGRKALVHVSQGMAMRPWEELYDAVGEAFQGARTASNAPMTADERQTDLNQRSAALGAIDSGFSGKRRGTGLATDVQELTAFANASQVSFYTIRPFLQSGGLPAEFSGSVANLYTPSMQATRAANVNEMAQTLAESTGGVSLAGGDLGALLATAERDFRGYYSLAYRPPPGRQPSFHEIKVKVKGRGQVIRYRKGFFEKPPIARFGDRATAALLLERADNPIGLSIELTDVQATGGRGERTATLVVIIPLEKLSLTPTGTGQWSVAGQIYLAASDPLGGTAPVQLVDLVIPIEAADEATARAERYGARMKIVASPGSQRIGVGFVDQQSGLESYVAESFDVP